jgi:hypothetical protein
MGDEAVISQTGELLSLSADICPHIIQQISEVGKSDIVEAKTLLLSW